MMAINEPRGNFVEDISRSSKLSKISEVAAWEEPEPSLKEVLHAINAVKLIK